MSTVTCVPGGHGISICHAFWCQTCRIYLCYKHAHHSFWTTSIRCRRGHAVIKAR